ncbi:MAG: PQQ-binding-like beta-propeller repeat protein [Spirochaetales bacterium]|nr:PQQ-binding-like beta-propeller repeat protein [Spirochaetales bacterium]
MKSFLAGISQIKLLTFILVTACTSFLCPSENEIPVPLSLKSVFSTGGRISGPPLEYPGGGIIFFSEDRYLYRFDSFGVFLSRKKAGSGFSPFHAQGIDGIIYKYFRDNTLKAVNAAGGILWSVKNNSTPFCAPVISSAGAVITAGSRSILTCYSYRGRKRWELDLKNSIKVAEGEDLLFSCPPCAGAQGRIFAGMSSGRIASVDSSGKITKSINSSGYSITALVSAGKKVYASDSSGRLLVYSEDLELQKNFKLKSPAVSIRSGRNILAIVHRSGSASVYDDEMTLLYSSGTSMKITGDPLVAGKYVYFLSGRGFVSWFDPESGAHGEEAIPAKAVTGIRGVKDEFPRLPFIYKEGPLLAAGGEDWNIYFFHAPASSPADRKSTQQYSEDEDLYSLRPDTGFLIYINELLMSDDPGEREKAMKLAENALSSGITAGDEEYLIQMIRNSALRGRGNVFAGKGMTGPGSASVKSTAAVILGRLGTHDALALLREILKAETDPFAASVEIRELGKAGSDYDGRSIAEIISAWNRFHDYPGINETIIESFKGITSYHGYFPSQEGKKLLFKMLERNRNRELQLKVIELLKYMEQ